jgi:hypothetical protein
MREARHSASCARFFLQRFQIFALQVFLLNDPDEPDDDDAPLRSRITGNVRCAHILDSATFNSYKGS